MDDSPAAVVSEPATRGAPLTHIPALDGVRGVAILLVMAHHFVNGSHSGSRLVNIVASINQAGWVGVDLFFVLSGFLITRILLKERHKEHYFRNFYMRRTLRIFPLYYGVVALLSLGAIAGLNGPLHIQSTPAVMMAFWFYGVNFVAAVIGNGPFGAFFPLWSLVVEEHFYLVWPAIVKIFDAARLQWICLAIIAGAFVCRVMLIALHSSWLGPYVLTPCRIDAMAIGAILVIRSAISKNGSAISAVTACVMFATAAAAITICIAKSGKFNSDSGWVETIGFTAVDMLAAVFIAMASRPGSFVGKLMGMPLFTFFGKYSYGLYMCHCSVQFLLEPYTSTEALQRVTHSFAISGMLSVFTKVAVSTCLAVLSYQLYEKQFLSLKKYFQTSHERTGGSQTR